MTNLRITPQMRERLDRLHSDHPKGLFTDIDGTISAIAPTPNEAVLYPGIATFLVKATQVFAIVAAVSGRAAPDARRMLGIAQLTYIGNHGLERIAPGTGEEIPTMHVHPAAQPSMPAINHVLDTIEARLGEAIPGMLVERKGVSGSIHYRGAEDPAAAESTIATLAGQLAAEHNLRVTHGKMVIELRPPVHVDKGTILTEIIQEMGLQGALYLGDDRTDIDAFRALRQLTATGACVGIAVAVLHDEAPPELAQEADIVLRSIAEVPLFLKRLLRAQKTKAVDAVSADRGQPAPITPPADTRNPRKSE